MAHSSVEDANRPQADDRGHGPEYGGCTAPDIPHGDIAPAVLRHAEHCPLVSVPRDPGLEDYDEPEEDQGDPYDRRGERPRPFSTQRTGRVIRQRIRAVECADERIRTTIPGVDDSLPSRAEAIDARVY